MRALVTGGAGYVGSHMVRTLLDAGHEVVVVDDLSSGHRDAIPPTVQFVFGDVAHTEDMRALLTDAKVDAVFHFAAKIRVDESVTDPQKYYQGNLVASLALLEAVLSAAVPNFILSSTAAVYGTPDELPIDEDHVKRPLNAYGATKLAVERALESYGTAYGLRWAALRYFNAAGAHPEAGLGERHEPESHLIPLVLDVARGKRSSVSIYGNNWPTPDGTCVRDYVHVRDLCGAHLAAVLYLQQGGQSGPFNLGTGQGNSVREVVSAAEQVTGVRIPVVEAPARPGDPPALVAGVERARRVLGFAPSRSDLWSILRDAWAFMQTHTPPLS